MISIRTEVIALGGYEKFIDNIIKKTYDINDKGDCIRQHISYMLNRTQSMFSWTGLPPTIPEHILELYLQTNGNVCFYEHEGSLYVFTGGMGGIPDVYYRPTIYTIANPALNISKSLKIDEDCVVVKNDSLYVGVLPLFTRYASLLTENEISLKLAIINSRIVSLISAPDDRTKASADIYLKDIYEGKMGVIAENSFLDGIKTSAYGNTSTSGTLLNLIETEQYLKASWFNEIGLNANYNMKREAINSSESALNEESLMPLVDDMLKCRTDGAAKINEKYGLNVTVELNSSWKDIETKGGEDNGIE